MLSLTYHQLSLYPVRLSFDRDGSRLKLQKPSQWGWRERNPAIYNGMKLFCYQIMRVVSPVLAMIDGWLVISTDKYSQDTRTLRSEAQSNTRRISEYPSWRMEARTLCQVVAWDNGLCWFFQLSEFNNTGGILKLFHSLLNTKRTPFLRKYYSKRKGAFFFQPVRAHLFREDITWQGYGRKEISLGFSKSIDW